MRRLALGSTRPTSNPPRSLRRWSMTVSSISILHRRGRGAQEEDAYFSLGVKSTASNATADGRKNFIHESDQSKARQLRNRSQRQAHSATCALCAKVPHSALQDILKVEHDLVGSGHQRHGGHRLREIIGDCTLRVRPVEPLPPRPHSVAVSASEKIKKMVHRSG